MQKKPSPTLPFIGLILAAGYARRMQSNKLLLPWQGKALVRHVIEQVLELQLADVFSVVRHDADEALLDAMRNTKIIRTHNAHKGMGASLASGMQGLIEYMKDDLENSAVKPTIEDGIIGAIVFLGDMPTLQNATVGELCKQALRYPTCPHAPVYDNQQGRQVGQGQQGHPVIIPKHLWPSLSQLDGEAGAKKLLQEQGLRLMPTHDSNVCMDIDTPNAYQALLNQSTSK